MPPVLQVMRIASVIFSVVLATIGCGQKKHVEQKYAQHCAACHEAGAGGAPAKSAKRDWQIRRNQTPDALLASVRRGIVGMPPSGRCFSCSDAELIEIIRYMRD